jgi:hypothetical protein
MGFDHVGDQKLLFWGGGAKARVVIANEEVALLGVLAREKSGSGVDAVLEGVHFGSGLSLIGAGAG